jgi:dienelactone hydrolase
MSEGPELALMYFPGNYRWSIALLLALGGAPWGGAEMGEIHRIGLRLKDRVGDDQAWYEEWTGMAAHLERQGRADRHPQSAAAYLFRAAHYYHIGERFLHPKTDEGLARFKRGVDCFRDATRQTAMPKLESVEVPYDGKSLPAILVHAHRPQGGRAPAMVYFDGLDITKEIQYFRGVPDLALRGISCLIIDGPGNGESIRFRGFPLDYRTEKPASAAFDYLASRSDIDPHRIGVLGISLGGYFAPRAAAFERRFACCVAWGAQWDYHAIWKRRFELLSKGGSVAMPTPSDHILWMTGTSSREAALKALEGFRLDAVVQKVECPFLLVHGEGDAQIPLADAQRCFDAVGSRQKVFKVFTRDEGGYHHCQEDNTMIGIAYMWNWLEDVLQSMR